jgi:hypothetical protein
MVAAATLAVVAAACSGDSPTTVDAPDVATFAQTTDARVVLCKITFKSFDEASSGYVPGVTEDPTLGVDFEFDITGGDVSNITLAAASYVGLSASECAEIYSGPAGNPLTIIETSPNSIMNSVFVADGLAPNFNFLPDGTWSAATDVRTISTAAVPAGENWVYVKNTVIDTPPPPPPPGMQGCTPGYWRQTQHFGNWSYNQSDLYSAIFGVAYEGTLLQAVWARGGGVNALARHSVAALLNAASGDVAYPYTVDQVIAAVQGAFATGEYERVKNRLAYANELGCDLGRADVDDADDLAEEAGVPTRGQAKGKNKG